MGIVVVAYDTIARPWMLEWGSTTEEQRLPLPGDEVPDDTMTHHTRAITIHAPTGGRLAVAGANR